MIYNNLRNIQNIRTKLQTFPHRNVGWKSLAEIEQNKDGITLSAALTL